MQLQQLQCPQCGGQLDASAAQSRTPMTCGNCDARFLVSDGSVRDVGSYALPETKSTGTLRTTVQRKLKKMGVKSVPSPTDREESIRYLMRRGRARVSPRARQSGNHSVAKEHAEVREGLFGLPLDEGTDAAMLFFPDASSLETTQAPLPDDLPDHLLRFEDRIELALGEDLDQRIYAKTKPIKYGWAGFDVKASWHEDIYLLDIAVSVFTVTLRNLPAGRFELWSDTRPDHTYEIAYNRHDGSILRSTLPSKGKNGLLILGIFIALVVGLPLVIGLLFSVLMVVGPILIGLVSMAVGVALGA